MLESKTRDLNDKLYVVEGSGGSLLSWKISQELNVLQTVQQVTSLPSQPEAKTPADLSEEYDDLFHGLGKLMNYRVKLHFDEDITPVAQPHRRVPFHVRKTARGKATTRRKAKCDRTYYRPCTLGVPNCGCTEAEVSRQDTRMR